MSEDRPTIIAKEVDNVLHISIGGNLNAKTLPASREMVDEIIDVHEINKRQNLKILINYEKVLDVDSATIADILDRLAQHQENNHKIAFVNVPEEFKSIIEIHKLEDKITIFDSEEEALKELKKPTQ